MGEFAKGGTDKVKMRILHAIDRDLAEMSVEEIAEKAGISRQTFYRNFSSKFDIFTWHAIQVERLYLDEVGRTLDWETGYFHHFRLLAEERQAYAVGLRYTGDALFGTDPMPSHRREILIETLRDWRHVDLTDEMLFCVDAFTKLETELADKWFRDGLPDPACFARRMCSVVPHALYDAMRLPGA